jgi:hypothetical protein
VTNLELSEEQRRQIYEEEKAKIDAASSTQKPRGALADLFWAHPLAWTVLAVLVVIIGLRVAIQPSQQSLAPAKAVLTPVVHAKPKANKKPVPASLPESSNYKSALGYAGDGEFLSAISLLQEVPRGDKNYKRAQAKIREYKSKGKIKATADAAKSVKAEAAAYDVANPVRVAKGWSYEEDSYGNYEHITGSIVNHGIRPVRYWKVTAKFTRNGSIVDTAYTNGAQTILPGAAKRFSIMHENIPGTSASVEVDDVRFE